MLERNPYLVNKAFRTYLVATVLASMALSLGVVIDGVIVGNLLGPNSLSAINLTSPLIQLLSAITVLINVGGATLAAIFIGRGKTEDASRIFTTSVVINLIVGVVITVLGTVFIDEIVSVLCSDASLAPLVKDYASVVLISSLLYMLLPGICVFVRTDSNPKLATAALVIANIVNLGLDIVFIEFMNLGVGSSALATSLGYLVGVCILLIHVTKKERVFRFKFSGIKYAGSIFAMGAPVALASALMTVRLFGMNSIVLQYLGADGVSVMAVCLNLMMIASMFIGGTAQTMQPIGGVLQGSEDYRGMNLVIKAATKILIICLAVLVSLIFLFPGAFASFFGLTDPELVNFAEPALRIFSLCLPLYGINYMLMIIYQIQGHKKLASAVSSAQALMVVVVALILVPMNNDLIWASFAIGELIVLAGTSVAAYVIHKKRGLTTLTLQKTAPEGAFIFDVSMKGDGSDMKSMMDELHSYLVSSGLSASVMNRIELCCEELTLNVIEHGLNESKNHYLDINIKEAEDNIVITIKDDGPVFDPIKYDGDGKGLLLVKGICSSISYSRAMDQNLVTVKVLRS
ncbi:hypothetical protein A3206_06930 [Candidatus Methanomassiliicoccus intestinalis]|uniref:MATE family efflux transporter n=1 Tax=Candidatus Methanomassiliicoccus intestinalis TaxID=1406512 RepID=UPI0037DCED63|nr:MAG: hypothetical protein A3206_06930 [Candidatus Methanomassiliicoccus intestinalis]